MHSPMIDPENPYNEALEAVFSVLEKNRHWKTLVESAEGQLAPEARQFSGECVENAVILWLNDYTESCAGQPLTLKRLDNESPEKIMELADIIAEHIPKSAAHLNAKYAPSAFKEHIFPDSHIHEILMDSQKSNINRG